MEMGLDQAGPENLGMASAGPGQAELGLRIQSCSCVL